MLWRESLKREMLLEPPRISKTLSLRLSLTRRFKTKPSEKPISQKVRKLQKSVLPKPPLRSPERNKSSPSLKRRQRDQPAHLLHQAKRAISSPQSMLRMDAGKDLSVKAGLSVVCIESALTLLV